MRTCTGLKHFINFNQGYSAFVLNELKEVKNHCCCCRTNVITEMEGLVGHLGISVGPDGDIFILAQLLYQQISDRDGEAELSFWNVPTSAEHWNCSWFFLSSWPGTGSSLHFIFCCPNVFRCLTSIKQMFLVSQYPHISGLICLTLTSHISRQTLLKH